MDGQTCEMMLYGSGISAGIQYFLISRTELSPRMHEHFEPKDGDHYHIKAFFAIGRNLIV